jgi:glycosyltransferase involved in cell wall biosynthesis
MTSANLTTRAERADFGGSGRQRLLILGPINTPHTEHLALGARERGFDVVVGGEIWGTLPDTTLAEQGIDVSVTGWPTARWLRNLIARVRPHVVHANWFPYAFTYMLYGASPLVAMAWGSDIYRADRVTQVKNRVVARYAGMVMADSADLLDQLHALGAPPSRSVLLNWGIDLVSFSPPKGGRAAVRQQLGLPDGRIVLSPRAFRDLYNPRTIIDAFELLAHHDDDLHLVMKHIHADRPDLGPLRYPQRVHTIGYVPYERMADYYRAADVCVSIPSSDSSPRSVWEAMGCGTPCVLSDLPWVHELIADEREALVVPIEATSVAAATHRLLEDSSLAATVVTRARSLVERHRNRDHELDRLIEVYERLARERPGTSRRMRALQSVAAKAAIAVAVARRRAAVPRRTTAGSQRGPAR